MLINVYTELIVSTRVLIEDILLLVGWKRILGRDYVFIDVNWVS